MAIDRIPGVGPQNTDIATAVAAAVPTIAAITSSITTNAASAGLTNASITSAGNAAGWGATGPTTTQIAAAVPTLAQITTAITTNAASVGTTVAAITSAGNSAGWANTGPTTTQIVTAGNAAGWGLTGGETWTAISTVNTVGGTNFTYTFSSLSGYKTYRLVFSGCGAAGDQTFYFRINGVGGYHWMIRNQLGNTASTYGSRGDTVIPLNPTSGMTTNRINGYIDFPQANLIGMKAFQGEFHSLNNAFTNSNRWSLLGNIESATAAITSIEFTANNNQFTVGWATLYGGN